MTPAATCPVDTRGHLASAVARRRSERRERCQRQSQPWTCSRNLPTKHCWPCLPCCSCGLARKSPPSWTSLPDPEASTRALLPRRSPAPGVAAVTSFSRGSACSQLGSEHVSEIAMLPLVTAPTHAPPYSVVDGHTGSPVPPHLRRHMSSSPWTRAVRWAEGVAVPGRAP